MSFAKRQTYFYKRKLGLDLPFFKESTFETRLSKRILFWSKTLEIRACFGKEVQKLGSVLDFWMRKIDPGWWHIPVYSILGSAPPPGMSSLQNV